jgi:hypothetical protein
MQIMPHCKDIFTGILMAFSRRFFVIKFDSVNIPLVESRVGLSLSQKYKTKMEVDGTDRGNELQCFFTVVKSFIDQVQYSQRLIS